MSLGFLQNIKSNKTSWLLFMDGVQLPQGYSHFEEVVYFLPLSSQKYERPQKNERLSWSWSHIVVLNTGLIDCDHWKWLFFNSGFDCLTAFQHKFLQCFAAIHELRFTTNLGILISFNWSSHLNNKPTSSF